MASVFLVQMECGDYYCGCGGGHPVGAYSTLEAATAALGAAKAVRYSYTGHGTPMPKEVRPDGTHAAWSDGEVYRVPLDSVPVLDIEQVTSRYAEDRP